MNCFSRALCGRGCSFFCRRSVGRGRGRPRPVGRTVGNEILKRCIDMLCPSACHSTADGRGDGVATHSTSQVKWFEMLQHVWLIAERSWLGTRVERTGQAQCRASRHSLRLFLLVFKQRLSFLPFFSQRNAHLISGSTQPHSLTHSWPSLEGSVTRFVIRCPAYLERKQFADMKFTSQTAIFRSLLVALARLPCAVQRPRRARARPLRLSTLVSAPPPFLPK